MVIKNNKMKLLFIVIVTVTVVYIGFEYVLPLFAPFIVAYLIASALLPLVRLLNSKIRLPKLFGGIITLGVIGSGIGYGSFYLMDILIKQIVNLLKNMPIYLAMLSGYLDKFCESCDKILGVKLGSMQSFIYSNFDGILVVIKDKIIPVITTRSLNLLIAIIGFVGILLIMLVSILLLIKDEEQYKSSMKESVFYQDIHIVTSKLSEMGIAYLRTQGIMMLLISAVCTVGMLLIRNKYALIIGMAIGIFDAFPILGSGLILVPWGIAALFNQDFYTAAILLTVYAGCQMIRQFLEPRLLGNRIGIKPVYTLMAMYVGVRVFGFAGFILGPVGLVIITTVVKEAQKRLNISIRDNSEISKEG